MIDHGKKNVIGVLIDAVDYDAAIDKVITAAQQKRPFAVSALAVHGVMTGVLDSEHRYRLNQLDLVVPDGQPVRWALNLLHSTKLSDRVYGPNLTLYVCEHAAKHGLPIYLYGSTSDVLEALQVKLKERFPQIIIAGSEASKFRQLTPEEIQDTAKRIKDSGAAITMVGLGCPRQEVWAYEMRDLLGMPLLAVGAAFNFHAGLLPQAPPTWQKYGFEWLYRLIQEPKRLWRRYLYLNPLYLGKLALQYLKLRKYDPADCQQPTKTLAYG